MTLFRTEAEEPRTRQVPDVIAVQAGRKQIRLHQYAGAGMELGVWREHKDGQWVRYREPVRLKRWEAIALVRSLVEVMKDRETRKIPDFEERMEG